LSKLFVDEIQPKTTGGVINAKGMVIQVKSTASSQITHISTQDVKTDILGLSVSITPKSTSSKILVQVHVNHGGTDVNTYGSGFIVRDSTEIGIGSTATGNRQNVSFALSATGHTNETYKLRNASMTFLDDPQTTSSITYKVQARMDANPDLYINRSGTDANADYGQRGISTITVMEIGG
tara:strand:- start:1589 stop:2128 length:540 start_codon:yes stop_codon:yes gene_type:complete